jgi:hypothetical protein
MATNQIPPRTISAECKPNSIVLFAVHVQALILLDRLAKQSEAARYGPLTSAINSILLRYHGAKVGGMAHAPGEGDLIYAVQDPSNISSASLTAEGPELKTLRKPDVVGVTVKRLGELLGSDGSFSDWVTRLTDMNDQDWKNLERKERTEWVDPWNVWELKYSESIKKVVFPVFTFDEFWTLEEGMPPQILCPHGTT